MAVTFKPTVPDTEATRSRTAWLVNEKYADALERAWREVQSRFRYAMMMRTRAIEKRISWWERRRFEKTFGKDEDIYSVIAAHWEREVEDLGEILQAIDRIRQTAADEERPYS